MFLILHESIFYNYRFHHLGYFYNYRLPLLGPNEGYKCEDLTKFAQPLMNEINIDTATTFGNGEFPQFFSDNRKVRL